MQKKMHFLRYCTFGVFLGLNQFFGGNSDLFQIRILGFLRVNGPFYDYVIKECTVLKAVLFAILDVFVFLWDSQFFEVKFRPLPNRMFMISMG